MKVYTQEELDKALNIVVLHSSLYSTSLVLEDIETELLSEHIQTRFKKLEKDMKDLMEILSLVPFSELEKEGTAYDNI